MSRKVTEEVLWEAYSPGDADAHGNIADGWSEGERRGIYAFDPGSSTEPRLPGQQRVITVPTIYMPSTIVFAARDRVTVHGLLFEVEGETKSWKHPDGSQRGNVVELRRVTG